METGGWGDPTTKVFPNGLTRNAKVAPNRLGKTKHFLSFSQSVSETTKEHGRERSGRIHLPQEQQCWRISLIPCTVCGRWVHSCKSSHLLFSFCQSCWIASEKNFRCYITWKEQSISRTICDTTTNMALGMNSVSNFIASGRILWDIIQQRREEQ